MSFFNMAISKQFTDMQVQGDASDLQIRFPDYASWICPLKLWISYAGVFPPTYPLERRPSCNGGIKFMLIECSYYSFSLNPANINKLFRPFFSTVTEPKCSTNIMRHL